MFMHVVVVVAVVCRLPSSQIMEMTMITIEVTRCRGTALVSVPVVAIAWAHESIHVTAIEPYTDLAVFRSRSLFPASPYKSELIIA